MMYPDLKKLIDGSKTVITTVIAVVLSISCRAGGGPDTAAKEKGQDSAAGTVVTILDVYNSKYKDDPAKRNTAGIEDMITIKVKNLKALIRRAYCLDTSEKTIPYPNPVQGILTGYSFRCKWSKLSSPSNVRMDPGVRPALYLLGMEQIIYARFQFNPSGFTGNYGGDLSGL
jgi:hypothetical protein